MCRRLALVLPLLFVAAPALAQPTVRAVGTISSAAAATCAPGLPSGNTAGDLLLMFCESAGGETCSASGWSQLPTCSPSVNGSGTAGTRLTVLYKTAVGGDATTTNNPGDHCIARIVGITTGTYDTGTPFNICTSNQQAATGSVSISGTTTTVGNTLVVVASTGDVDPASNGTAEWSGWANANLTSITEQIDNSRTSGNGGQLGVATGIAAAIGNYGATTVTAATSTSFA